MNSRHLQRERRCTKYIVFLIAAYVLLPISHIPNSRGCGLSHKVQLNVIGIITLPNITIAVQLVVAESTHHLVAESMNIGNTLKMAAAEDESFIPAAKLAPDERLEWVPLSLTLVEYPQGNYSNKHVCVSRGY